MNWKQKLISRPQITFGSLARHRDFRLFWSGQIISLTGSWMQTIALSWLVFELTDSAFWLAAVSLISLLPVLPVSLVAGVLSDRFPRRRILLVTELTVLIQAFVLAFLTWSGLIQVWHIIVLSFVLGVAVAIEQPARFAFIHDIVGKDDLTNAIGLNATINSAARIIGPALAGLLIAAVGEALIFFINGISYAVVLIILLLIKPRHTRQASVGMSIGGSMVEGLKYMWFTPHIKALLAIVAVFSFLTLPYLTLMPVFTEDVLMTGAQGLGFLMSAVGVGAVAGALFVANTKHSQERILALSAITTSVFLLMFCFSQSLLLSILLAALVAGSNMIRQALTNSLLQLQSAEAYIGRVLSMFGLFGMGMPKAGALIAGALTGVIGIQWAIGLGAVVSLFIGIYIWWRMPHLARPEREPYQNLIVKEVES